MSATKTKLALLIPGRFGQAMAQSLREGVYNGCHPADIEWAAARAAGHVTPHQLARVRATANPARESEVDADRGVLPKSRRSRCRSKHR
jgi:hypothetical protein